MNSCTSDCPTGPRSTSTRARGSWASRAPTDHPAVWLNDDSHIRFYGGDVSESASGGMAGTGVVVYDSSYLSWWGFRVHDVGGAGMYLTGIKKASDHLDFKGDVYDWGHNLKWDPHTVKGTGLQGVNVADSHYGVNESRLAFHVHNSRAGSGLEMGGAVATDGARGNTIYLWCQELTIVAPNMQGGNCAQVWGENVTGNRFKYISGSTPHRSSVPGGRNVRRSVACDGPGRIWAVVPHEPQSGLRLGPLGQSRWHGVPGCGVIEMSRASAAGRAMAQARRSGRPRRVDPTTGSGPRSAGFGSCSRLGRQRR